MSSRNLIGIIRSLNRGQFVFYLTLAFALSYGLGAASALLIPQGGTSALWWPAAGVNLMIAMATPRKYRIYTLGLIVAVSTASSMTGGRTWTMAVLLGAASAIEILVVMVIFATSRERMKIDTTRDVARFIGACVAGAVSFGVLAGLAFTVIQGADFYQVGVSTAASHVSALLVFAPLALVRRPSNPPGTTPGRILGFVILLGSVTIVFFPGNTLPLTFLPIAAMLALCFAFSMFYIQVSLLSATILAVVLAVMGGGPFLQSGGTVQMSVALMEFYLFVFAGLALFFSAAKNERDSLHEKRLAAEGLLREGVTATKSGFLIVQEDAGELLLLECNTTAALLLAGNEAAEQVSKLVIDPLDPPPVPKDSPVYEVLRELAAGTATTWSDEWRVGPEGDTLVGLYATKVRGTTQGLVMTVEVIDLTAQREQEIAIRAVLGRERNVTDTLRQLNKQKDDFIATVNHELRTPITSILGFADNLADGELDEYQKKDVDIIIRNGERLAELVEDLLTVSRLSSGDNRPGQPLAVNRSVSICLDELTPAADLKRLTIVRALECEDCRVNIYPNDFTRVVSNLVTNAIKYTGEGGTVQVFTHRTGNDLTLIVRDDGDGIAPDELEHVFERFYRATPALHSTTPGTGLGLPIVKSIVEQWGGRIWLESDGKTGTTATVVLPILD